jgi:hypothetical protein
MRGAPTDETSNSDELRRAGAVEAVHKVCASTTVPALKRKNEKTKKTKKIRATD